MCAADGVELKGKPAVEADGMLWPQHLDPMHTVYPALGQIQCPVSIISGPDVSSTNPTEFIATYIEKVAKEFSRGRFERSATPLQRLSPFLSTHHVIRLLACFLPSMTIIQRVRVIYSRLEAKSDLCDFLLQNSTEFF